jgi:hypothetical protein
LPTSFHIGEEDPPTVQAFFKEAVLFLQILDHVLLVAIDPAGEHHS